MTTRRTETEGVPIACTLPASDLAARRSDIIAQLQPGVEEVRELTDGYELRFPGDEEWVSRLAAFIAGERECCAFLAFQLRFEPQHGPVLMRITGPAGAKAFLGGFIAERA